MTNFQSTSQSTDLAEAVLSGLNHPVFALNASNCFLFINSSGEEFFKSSLSFLKGEPLSTFIENDHGIFTMIDRVKMTGASLSDQGVELFSGKLGQRLVDIQVSPLLNIKREVIGIIVAFQERSLAERLRGHEQFRGAARSMTSLSALLAHEIKNPLAGIRGAAELLTSAVDKNEIKDLTNLIVNETDRIASLLTRMERLAGGQTISREPVNIHEVIDHCINLTKRSFGQSRQIITSFDPSLPDTEGDKDLLIQVVLNLLKNACEATENDGLIKIRTSFNLGARFSSNQNASASPLVVEVIDNGKGIDAELRDRIFDPFISNKPSGTGLGLSLVASTMADHAGGVEVSSRPGSTSFKLNFPISSQQTSMLSNSGDVK